MKVSTQKKTNATLYPDYLHNHLHKGTPRYYWFVERKERISPTGDRAGVYDMHALQGVALHLMLLISEALFPLN